MSSAWKDRLPREVHQIIDKTVQALEKKCMPCQIIISKVITDRRAMMEDKLPEHVSEAMKKFAKYAYHKGIVDYHNLSERDRERIISDAKMTVIHFEARIITPNGPIE